MCVKRQFERDSVRRDYDNERLDCERRMRAMECLLDCVQACRDAEIEFPWPLEVCCAFLCTLLAVKCMPH